MGLFGVFVAVLWWWSADKDPAIRNMSMPVVLVALMGVLLVWLCVGRLPLTLRLIGFAAVLLPPIAVAALYEVEDVRFDGGMFPIVHPRWWSRPDDILEQHLADAKLQAVPDSVNLSGKLPTDWAQYRGPNRDGIVLGPDLVRDWNQKSPRQLWKHPIGAGHSAFAVVNKVLFTLEQRRDQEAITCYNAETGLQYWAFTYPALHKTAQGDRGPRSTPTVVDGEVYALGATGMLTCLDARTGKPKWGPIDMLAGNRNVAWGISGSPLIVDDLVVLNIGVQTANAPNGTVVAVERKTGKVAWSSGKAEAGYSSPMLATLAGKRQIVLFDGEGVAGYDPAAKGKELWRYPWKTDWNINVAQPLIIGDNKVFITSAYDVGCAVLEVTENQGSWAVKEVWRKSTAMRCKFTTPVFYQGHIYGLDGETLKCVNAQTGAKVWAGRKHGFGQVLLSKDLLIVQGEFGEVALVEATPAEARELGSIQPWTDRTWNVPALADGRLYMRNHLQMACYDLMGK
jgi:outer membrane protein assembly factor BamB